MLHLQTPPHASFPSSKLLTALFFTVIRGHLDGHTSFSFPFVHVRDLVGEQRGVYVDRYVGGEAMCEYRKADFRLLCDFKRLKEQSVDFLRRGMAPTYLW